MTAAVVPLLTPTQSRILAAIREYASINGYPPTVRELSAKVRLSVTGVQYQLEQLQAKGWIRRVPGRPRALVVLDPATGQP
ncbi:hypothetical protein Ade02nite_19210 [Paractinoplanes deccanensis]|uniref:LexA repressor DNA-binding domain-containing protein n=1 Tax=Paractinoplanes deccanensis TaxID=113561 RepID=A0ABQ3XZZ6_9ACTN|nr:MarR family transcriptional regulator [Actinoplanes deccanensis]GID73280.1 hypothetical protein Ade02nite_19210 [Actinoplanes deccanensis]